MSDGRIVVGIDVGTYKIVTVIAKVTDAVNVLGVSEVKSAGIKKGQIAEITFDKAGKSTVMSVPLNKKLAVTVE